MEVGEIKQCNLSLVVLGKDVCRWIVQFLEDYEDWNSLRSTCTFYRKVLNFDFVFKHWKSHFCHQRFPIPTSFLELVRNIELCRQIEKSKPTLVSKPLPYHQYTENLFIQVTKKDVTLFSKKSGKVVAQINIKNIYCVATQYHVVLFSKNFDRTIIDENGNKEFVQSDEKMTVYFYEQNGVACLDQGGKDFTCFLSA